MNERQIKGSTVPHAAIQDPLGMGRYASAPDGLGRCIWTERMLVALERGVKGGKWFSLIDKVWRLPTLTAAWQRVQRNRGAAGVDGQSVRHFASRAPQYLQELSEALQEGRYRPQAVRRVDIPKGAGKSRPLGIPTVKDRIVQMAVKMVIEPIFEQEFVPTSYGFRPGRSCADALREVHRWLKAGYTHVVDADLQSYFDSIPQDRLLAQVGQKIGDGRLLALLQAWLRQDIVQGMKRWRLAGGTPQGAVISPLLANIYLHGLDRHMGERGWRMVRYADDFVILCQSRPQAERALAQVRGWTQANGLSLHPHKTHIGDCRQPGQGFEFLGYRFEAGRCRVRPKSLKALKEKVRCKTRRTRGQALAVIIADLNPILRGWFGYFKHARRDTFRPLDGFVRRRLRAILRRQDRRPGQGRCYADHLRWPNAFFARAGLFTLAAAWQQANQSR